jgi:hypothetical protein
MNCLHLPLEGFTLHERMDKELCQSFQCGKQKVKIDFKVIVCGFGLREGVRVTVNEIENKKERKNERKQKRERERERERE